MSMKYKMNMVIVDTRISKFINTVRCKIIYNNQPQLSSTCCTKVNIYYSLFTGNHSYRLEFYS